MGTAGTGTVVDFGTPRHTAYPYRGIAGMYGYIIVEWKSFLLIFFHSFFPIFPIVSRCDTTEYGCFSRVSSLLLTFILTSSTVSETDRTNYFVVFQVLVAHNTSGRQRNSVWVCVKLLIRRNCWQYKKKGGCCTNKGRALCEGRRRQTRADSTDEGARCHHDRRLRQLRQRLPPLPILLLWRAAIATATSRRRPPPPLPPPPPPPPPACCRRHGHITTMATTIAMATSQQRPPSRGREDKRERRERRERRG